MLNNNEGRKCVCECLCQNPFFSPLDEPATIATLSHSRLRFQRERVTRREGEL